MSQGTHLQLTVAQGQATHLAILDSPQKSLTMRREADQRLALKQQGELYGKIFARSVVISSMEPSSVVNGLVRCLLHSIQEVQRSANGQPGQSTKASTTFSKRLHWWVKQNCTDCGTNNRAREHESIWRNTAQMGRCVNKNRAQKPTCCGLLSLLAYWG